MHTLISDQGAPEAFFTELESLASFLGMGLKDMENYYTSAAVQQFDFSLSEYHPQEAWSLSMAWERLSRGSLTISVL